MYFCLSYKLFLKCVRQWGRLSMHKDLGGWKQKDIYLVRLKSFFPLIGPVVLNSLNDTKERAIALEVPWI